MPNLMPGFRSTLKEVFKDHLLSAFLITIMVISINHIVFSVLLFEREKTKAFDLVSGQILFTDLGSQLVPVGTNDVLLAEFWVPDAWLANQNLQCDFNIPGNPCVTMVDADGPATYGPGTDDDGASHLIELEPSGLFQNTIVQDSDNLCADDLTNPTCVYVDSGGDCDSTDGDIHYRILDTSVSPGNCGTASDNNVGQGSNNETIWFHSELVAANGAYDSYGVNIAYNDDGVCGGVLAVTWEPSTEAVWSDINLNNIFDANEAVFWDPLGCLVPGVTGVAAGGYVDPFFYDVPAPIGENPPGCSAIGQAGNGVWEAPTLSEEPIWDDAPSRDGLATFGPDGLFYPEGTFVPPPCLLPNDVGHRLVDAASITETLWIATHKADSVLYSGSEWNNPVLGQWQGDPLATWTGNEYYIELNSNNHLDPRYLATDEPIIVDLDGDGLYATTADTLVEADGTENCPGACAIGSNDETIAAGANLTAITAIDNVCVNTLGLDGSSQVILYIDGTDAVNNATIDGDGNCIPGDSGTDVLLRDDVGSGLIAGTPSSVFPNTFFLATFLLYYDDPLLTNPASGGWAYGSDNSQTESLWMEAQGAKQFNPWVEGAFLADADGAATPGTGTDDDTTLGLVRGSTLTYLNASDGVCFAYDLTSSNLEDIYIDTTGPGNGECDPTNEPPPFPIIIFDNSGDGLNSATVYGGSWASATGSGAYYDHLNGTNGSYDYCGGPNSPGCSYNLSGTAVSGDGQCPGNPDVVGDLSWDAEYEPVWDDIGATPFLYDPGEPIYWDNNGCLPAPIIGSAAPTPAYPLFYDQPSGLCSVPGQDGDGVWQISEPIWDDVPSLDGIATGPGFPTPWDNLLYPNAPLPPASCTVPQLSGGAGTPLINGAPHTETLWLELWVSSKYTAGPDIDVYSIGNGIDGDKLENLNGPKGKGPNSWAARWVDVDVTDGAINAMDTIVEDEGNVQTLTKNNSIIDRLEEVANRVTFRLGGNVTPEVDVNNLRAYVDFGAWGVAQDGTCDPGPGSIDDLPITALPGASLTYDPTTNQYVADLVNSIIPNFFRACLYADVPSTSTGGIIIPTLPEYIDNNGNGLYEPGDSGTFGFSNNRGAFGGDLTAAYQIAIPQTTSKGGHVNFNVSEPTPPPVTPPPDTPPPVTPPPTTPSPPPDSGAGPVLPAGVNVGDLVKTSGVDTVYLITIDGKRSPFPNEAVYFSYYINFAPIKTISSTVLSQIPLGPNVVVRPGSWLIKLKTNPKVFAVEPRGGLRWLETEEVARNLYGSNWTKRVIDMADVFFVDYNENERIQDGSTYPDGSLISFRNRAEIYYIEDGKKRYVSYDVFLVNSFIMNFVIDNLDPAVYVFADGDPYVALLDFFNIAIRNK